jgi:hypothetical protein
VQVPQAEAGRNEALEERKVFSAAIAFVVASRTGGSVSRGRVVGGEDEEVEKCRLCRGDPRQVACHVKRC